MNLTYNVIVIGAGIVGLSTAYNLLKKDSCKKILIIEKESDIAKHQTGNNSGVIHSGIYYKPGSLKATNCKKGYNLLLNFCEEHNVNYELCGKVIVATDKSELPLLNNILLRGKENGLEGLKPLSKEEIADYEPYCRGEKAIFVPQTGIVDYTEVSRKYLELIKKMGGEIVLSEKVIDIIEDNKDNRVITDRGEYVSKFVVNCAGLYSDKIAKLTIDKLGVKILPFRGEYYFIKPEKNYLVNNLIYPVPNPNFPFLGVHFTRMINGGREAGPNAVLAYSREGYTKSDINLPELFETLTYKGFLKVASKYMKMGMYEMYRSYSKSAFTKALQKLVPDITEDDLEVGSAGVRAQACDVKGNLIDDFLIFENHNIINVCNAPSPAATSSLSIGDTISNKILKV